MLSYKLAEDNVIFGNNQEITKKVGLIADR